MKNRQPKMNLKDDRPAATGSKTQPGPAAIARNTPLVVQPKLLLGPADDPFERQADQVAQNVGSGASPQLAGPLLSRKPTNSDSAIDPGLESDIRQSQSGGQPLPEHVRQPMEQSMGADFSRVRIHTDDHADRLNQALHARAFTTGQDIFFRQGTYNSASNCGKALLAHELTHTLQQTGDHSNGVAQRNGDDSDSSSSASEYSSAESSGSSSDGDRTEKKSKAEYVFETLQNKYDEKKSTLRTITNRLLDLLGLVPGFDVIIKIIKAARDFEAFVKTIFHLAALQKILKKTRDVVEEIVKYAISQKIKKAFKLAISLAQLGVIVRFYSISKAIFKWVKGNKGEKREQAAESLVEISHNRELKEDTNKARKTIEELTGKSYKKVNESRVAEKLKSS